MRMRIAKADSRNNETASGLIMGLTHQETLGLPSAACLLHSSQLLNCISAAIKTRPLFTRPFSCVANTFQDSSGQMYKRYTTRAALSVSWSQSRKLQEILQDTFWTFVTNVRRVFSGLPQGNMCARLPPDTDLGVVSYFRRGFLNRLSAPFIRAYCLLYGTGQ